ncbi:MAG: hypothetical protein DRJ35_04575 [Thermoprotei archaeon]|nr:MAG: hypothetical protein DRJ35_04575 [Thermoprotei archaeon]
MEYCSLTITTEFGKEKRVLMDTLDLLFPYDYDVEGKIIGPSKICIKTSIEDIDFLSRIFSDFPIRGLKIVRISKPIIEIKDLEKLPEKLIEYIKNKKSLKIRKIKRKSKDIPKNIYLKLLKNLEKEKLLSPDGHVTFLEIINSKVFLTLEIFRVEND